MGMDGNYQLFKADTRIYIQMPSVYSTSKNSFSAMDISSIQRVRKERIL